MTDELTNQAEGQDPTRDAIPGGSPESSQEESASSQVTSREGHAPPAREAGRGVDTFRGRRGTGERGRGGSGEAGGGRRGQRRGARGAQQPSDGMQPASGGFEEIVVKVYRCATVVKGGRRFSFSALAVVGDRKGQVGIGYGKANEVPNAVEKATKAARRDLVRVTLNGTTVPHRIMSKYGASKVLLLPAGEGTGVIAGTAVRAVLELAGIKDVLTKSYGSNSPKNLVKATFEGLKMLRSKEDVAKLREVAVAG